MAAGAAAANANNGWNRKTEQVRSAWAPDPKASGPRWLRLRLETPATIRDVHLTFEKSSAPCEVQPLSGGTWKMAGSLADGAPRRTVLRIPPTRGEALQIVFGASKGPVAVCEVRAYR